MGSRGQVLLKRIREMLTECAPGHRFVEKEHYYNVEYGGKNYRTLPKAGRPSRD